jgi:hypothetical protein
MTSSWIEPVTFRLVAYKMNLKNWTVLAEDNSEHSNSLNVVLKRNSELNYLLNIFPYNNLESDPQKTCHCLHCWRLSLATTVYLAVAWHWPFPTPWLASALFTVTRFLPSNRCLPGRCLAFAKHVWLFPASHTAEMVAQSLRPVGKRTWRPKRVVRRAVVARWPGMWTRGRGRRGRRGCIGCGFEGLGRLGGLCCLCLVGLGRLGGGPAAGVVSCSQWFKIKF